MPLVIRRSEYLIWEEELRECLRARSPAIFSRRTSKHPQTANQFATDLNQLAKDLQSWYTVSAAQQDYVTLSQDLENGATSSSATTSSSGITVSLLSSIAGFSSSLSAFTSELNQLGTDLNNWRFEFRPAGYAFAGLDGPERRLFDHCRDQRCGFCILHQPGGIRRLDSCDCPGNGARAIPRRSAPAFHNWLRYRRVPRAASVLQQLSSSFGSSSSSSSSISGLLGSLNSSNATSEVDLLA